MKSHDFRDKNHPKSGHELLFRTIERLFDIGHRIIFECMTRYGEVLVYDFIEYLNIYEIDVD